jgi:uncharacterized membrane protein
MTSSRYKLDETQSMRNEDNNKDESDEMITSNGKQATLSPHESWQWNEGHTDDITAAPTVSDSSIRGQHPYAGDESLTRLGWDEVVECSTAYVLGSISSILLLIFETYNRNVRFHAWQSFCAFTPLMSMKLIGMILFPTHHVRIMLLIGAIEILLACYMSYQTAQGHYIRIPFISNWAERCIANDIRYLYHS